MGQLSVWPVKPSCFYLLSGVNLEWRQRSIDRSTAFSDLIRTIDTLCSNPWTISFIFFHFWSPQNNYVLARGLTQPTVTIECWRFFNQFWPSRFIFGVLLRDCKPVVKSSRLCWWISIYAFSGMLSDILALFTAKEIAQWTHHSKVELCKYHCCFSLLLSQLLTYNHNGLTDWQRRFQSIHAIGHDTAHIYPYHIYCLAKCVYT